MGSEVEQASEKEIGKLQEQINSLKSAAAEKVEGAQGGLSSDAEQQLRNTMKKLEEELQQVQKERDTLQEKLKASKSPRPRSQLGADVTSEGKALALQEELDAAKAELKKLKKKVNLKEKEVA